MTRSRHPLEDRLCTTVSAVVGAVWPLLVLVAGAVPVLVTPPFADHVNLAGIVDRLSALSALLQREAVGQAVVGCILVALVAAAIRVHRQRRLAT